MDSQRGFNVANFRSHINARGVLKPNRFLVVFQLPPGLLADPNISTQSTEAIRSMEFWVEAVDLPIINLLVNQGTRYGYGAIEKRPIIPNFTDITCTLIADEKGDNWNVFYRWLNLIVNSNASNGVNSTSSTSARIESSRVSSIQAYPYEVGYKSEYLTDLKINVYDMTGKIAKSLVMREAYPIGISGPQLNWADNNSYLRLQVQFTFTDWYMDYIDSENPTR